MKLEERTRLLLDLVEAHRAKRCEELLSAARARARAIRGEAWREARMRLHAALGQERERAAREIALAQAQFNTRLRQHRQREANELLREAARRLPDALARRWRDPPARAQWAEAILMHAAALLPDGEWEIRHPPDWPAAERERAVRALAHPPRGAVRFTPDPASRAGLRVHAGHNVVDGSAAGLLVERAAIEARLLARLEESQA
jgi:hypothetical protein